MSFGTARAVELIRTSVVFLAIGCHRILGLRVKLLYDCVFAAAELILGSRLLARYRNALSFQCVVTRVTVW